MGSITARKGQNKMPRGGQEFEWIQLTPIAILFVIFAVVGMGYIMFKYFGIDEYGDYAFLLLMIGLIALACIFFMNSKKSLKLNNRYNLSDFNSIADFMIWVFLLIFCIEISIWVVNLTFRFALTPTDMYFYYISAAVFEELLFRQVLCGFLRIYTNLRSIYIALLAAIPFAMSHYVTYNGDFVYLLSIYAGGVIFGLFFLHTRDITITMTAHIIINIIMVGTLILQVSG